MMVPSSDEDLQNSHHHRHERDDDSKEEELGREKEKKDNTMQQKRDIAEDDIYYLQYSYHSHASYSYQDIPSMKQQTMADQTKSFDGEGQVIYRRYSRSSFDNEYYYNNETEKAGKGSWFSLLQCCCASCVKYLFSVIGEFVTSAIGMTSMIVSMTIMLVLVWKNPHIGRQIMILENQFTLNINETWQISIPKKTNFLWWKSSIGIYSPSSGIEVYEFAPPEWQSYDSYNTYHDGYDDGFGGVGSSSHHTNNYQNDFCPPMNGLHVTLHERNHFISLQSKDYRYDYFRLNPGSFITLNVILHRGSSNLYLLRGNQALQSLRFGDSKNDGDDDDIENGGGIDGSKKSHHHHQYHHHQDFRRQSILKRYSSGHVGISSLMRYEVTEPDVYMLVYDNAASTTTDIEISLTVDVPTHQLISHGEGNTNPNLVCTAQETYDGECFWMLDSTSDRNRLSNTCLIVKAVASPVARPSTNKTTNNNNDNNNNHHHHQEQDLIPVEVLSSMEYTRIIWISCFPLGVGFLLWIVSSVPHSGIMKKRRRKNRYSVIESSTHEENLALLGGRRGRRGEGSQKRRNGEGGEDEEEDGDTVNGTDSASPPQTPSTTGTPLTVTPPNEAEDDEEVAR